MGEVTLEYTREAIMKHKPTKVVIGGRLHVDGVPVYEWQLTEEELKEYFPDRYADQTGMMPCPLCDKEMRCDRRTWTMHVRIGHTEWYQQNREAVLAMEEFADLAKYVAEDRATKPEGVSDGENRL